MGKPGAYRDGFGALSRSIRGTVDKALRRGARLRQADRRRLPRRLRRELDELEGSLAPSPETIEDLSSQETQLADYEAALGVAETWLDSRRELLRRGRVHYAPAALALIALLLPLGTMLGLRYGALAIHCGARRPGMPKQANLTALVSADAPRCIAQSDIDCALLCQLRGLCVEQAGACVATAPEHCSASVACAVEGTCELGEGRCEAPTTYAINTLDGH